MYIYNLCIYMYICVYVCGCDMPIDSCIYIRIISFWIGLTRT